MLEHWDTWMERKRGKVRGRGWQSVCQSTSRKACWWYCLEWNRVKWLPWVLSVC